LTQTRQEWRHKVHGAAQKQASPDDHDPGWQLARSDETFAQSENTECPASRLDAGKTRR
jgi:hypothetical protein